MTTGRPSAKQAIEVLKIHQLRRENAVIFEEVKGLREDVNNRQSDLDETRKDVSKLTDEVKQMQQIVQEHGPRLAQLDAGSISRAEELKQLQQTYQSLQEELPKANTVFDAINLQNQNTIKELAEKVTLLNNQVAVCEKTCADSVDDLRDDLTSRVQKGVVADLEDKLEDFIQEMDARFEALQKVSYVTDSFATPRNKQDAKCDRVHNASSPTATIPSLKHTSDRGRWEPIDTQAALRATPPAMPETLILARPREDTIVQTPSTLRSTVPVREAISNIIHMRPVIEPIPAKAPQREDPPAASQVMQRQGPATESIQHPAGIEWEVLNEILKLRQCENETLARYSARFQAIAMHFPPDPDIVSVCLKRLVIGIRQDEEKQFVREWLMTSDWTVENVKDCILLLTRCKGRPNASHIEPGSLRLHETAVALAEICNVDHDFRQPDLSLSHSEQNMNTALPLNGRNGKQQNVPRQIESNIQRIQPARAAKTQKTSKANEDKRRQNEDVNVTRKPSGVNHERNETAEDDANIDTALKVGVTSIAEPTDVRQNVPNKKKSHKTRMERELRSLMNTKSIEKSIKEPPMARKRKSLHRSDEDDQPPNRLDQGSQTPPAKRHLKPRRIPMLVARSALKASTVPETSDTLRLPSMPPDPMSDHEQEDGEIHGTGQTSSHDTPPRIPVLSLSSSDFQE